MTRATGVSIRLYRWLSQALPEDFLKRHGLEMIAAGELTIQDAAARRGFQGLVVLMFHLVLDLTRRLPAEHLDEFVSDVRHGARVLTSSKGMVLVIALSTGLAIALVLGNYNEMLIVFHKLPGVSDPENLVTIQTPVSYTEFERYAMPNGPFVEVAAYMGKVPIWVKHEGTSQRIWGNIVTPNYFEVLKSSAAAGRTFSRQDEKGAP